MAIRLYAAATRSICLALAILALGACGPDGRGEDAVPLNHTGLSQRDSSGILISVTDGLKALAPLDWEIDTVPELELGSENDPDQQFLGIGGLRALPDGGVLVVDGISRELRFFDGDGRLLHREGGKGEGPGEFDRPELVHAVGNDSLLVWDGGLRRFQLFTGEGQDPQTIRLTKPWPAGGEPPLGAVGSRTLVRKPEMPGYIRFPPLGPRERHIDFLWVEPATGSELLLASYTENDGFVLGHTATGISVSTDIPFVPRCRGTVSRQTALITPGMDPEIKEYDLEGRLRRVFRVDLPGRAVTEEMIEAALEYAIALNGYTRAYAEDKFARLPIPDTLPTFASLQTDETGWLWAEVYPWDQSESMEWMVFDPAGFARGTIRTPAGLEILRIGEDFILGVWRDELGVEYVSRHRLRRS